MLVSLIAGVCEVAPVSWHGTWCRLGPRGPSLEASEFSECPCTPIHLWGKQRKLHTSRLWFVSQWIGWRSCGMPSFLEAWWSGDELWGGSQWGRWDFRSRISYSARPRSSISFYIFYIYICIAPGLPMPLMSFFECYRRQITKGWDISYTYLISSLIKENMESSHAWAFFLVCLLMHDIELPLCHKPVSSPCILQAASCWLDSGKRHMTNRKNYNDRENARNL